MRASLLMYQIVRLLGQSAIGHSSQCIYNGGPPWFLRAKYAPSMLTKQPTRVMSCAGLAVPRNSAAGSVVLQCNYSRAGLHFCVSATREP